MLSKPKWPSPHLALAFLALLAAKGYANENGSQPDLVAIYPDASGSVYLVPEDRVRSHFQAFCPQPNSSSTERWAASGAEMTEDCLLLNVYKPIVRENGKEVKSSFPVYAHIHGGFFSSGSAADFGVEGVLDGLGDQKVVVVTLQYRLGPHGFLNLIDPADPQRNVLYNIGLRDQLTALEWIQFNIARYGGDPTRVTLGGDGAGACSTAYHAATRSPATQHLFNKAILASGSTEACQDAAGSGGGKLSIGEKFLVKACPHVNYTADRKSLRAVFNCLHNLSMKEMASVELGLGMWEMALPDNFTVNPATESSTGPLSVLMGVARDAWLSYDEELQRQSELLRALDVEHPDHYLAGVLNYMFPELTDIDAFVNTTLELYEEAAYINRPNTAVQWKRFYIQAMTDAMLTSSIANDARLFQRAGHSVTLYKFVHEGPFFQRNGTDGDMEPVVPDAAEMAYLFQPEWLWTPLSAGELAKERHVAKMMAAVWAEFIHTPGPVVANDKDTFGSAEANPIFKVKSRPAGEWDYKGLSTVRTLVDTAEGVDPFYLELGTEVNFIAQPLLDDRIAKHWADFKKKAGIKAH